MCLCHHDQNLPVIFRFTSLPDVLYSLTNLEVILASNNQVSDWFIHTDYVCFISLLHENDFLWCTGSSLHERFVLWETNGTRENSRKFKLFARA